MGNGKRWGKDEFWGLGYEWDPQWLLTPEQLELQTRLIGLCASTLRDNAVESDRKLLFPRKNFEALAKLGLLGLIVPEEWQIRQAEQTLRRQRYRMPATQDRLGD